MNCPDCNSKVAQGQCDSFTWSLLYGPRLIRTWQVYCQGCGWRGGSMPACEEEIPCKDEPRKADFLY